MTIYEIENAMPPTTVAVVRNNAVNTDISINLQLEIMLTLCSGYVTVQLYI